MKATTTTIVCPVCKELVRIIDKKIEVHGECPASGLYRPPSHIRQRSPGASGVDIIGARNIQVPCDNQEHVHQGVEILFKVSQPDPTQN